MYLVRVSNLAGAHLNEKYMYEVTHRENYRFLLKLSKAKSHVQAALHSKTRKEKRKMQSLCFSVKKRKRYLELFSRIFFALHTHTYYLKRPFTTFIHEGNNNPPIFNEN